MRRFVLAAAALAALLIVGAPENRVAAMPVATPGALGLATPDFGGVQQVRWHRAWGGWGWRRPVYWGGPVYWGRPVYWGWHRRYWGGPWWPGYWRGPYWGGPYYYGGYYGRPCCWWGWRRRWWW